MAALQWLDGTSGMPYVAGILWLVAMAVKCGTGELWLRAIWNALHTRPAYPNSLDVIPDGSRTYATLGTLNNPSSQLPIPASTF